MSELGTPGALVSPLRELHEKLGAEFGEYFGCHLPTHYGAVDAEYRAARESVGLLESNFRAFLYFDGPDRVRYLNAVTTNNVRDLREGQGVIGLLLNPQGHILAELECLALADRVLVTSHALVREPTVQALDKYIIMDDVTLTDATPVTGSLALEGPGVAFLLGQMCAAKLDAMPVLSHREVIIGTIPCRLVCRSLFGGTGAELIVERDQLPALWQMLLDAARSHGGRPIGYAALNSFRLEAGIPWFSYDFDDRVIPHEAGLEESHISYTKGCYIGQEIVERVRSRGHVNRKRVSLKFSGASLPAANAQLLIEDKEVGYVTSAAHSPALGQAIGMGYLRREHANPGTQLTWETGTAEVAVLPFL